MTRSLAIAALCLACSGSSVADGISNPTTQFVGNMGEGINNSTSGGAPPGSCSGAIDLSTGCVQPMLGGL